MSIVSPTSSWDDSSQGVQLGNIASALGVVGTWSGGSRLPGKLLQSTDIKHSLNVPHPGVPVGKSAHVLFPSLV